jgi:hypothetical protein
MKAIIMPVWFLVPGRDSWAPPAFPGVDRLLGVQEMILPLGEAIPELFSH